MRNQPKLTPEVSQLRFQMISAIINYELKKNTNACPVNLYDTLHELDIDQLNERMFELIVEQESRFYAKIMSKK